MSSSNWQGKRVLVTGADGFIGSHLVEALVAEGARVLAFTRSTSVHGTGRLQLRNLAHLADDLEDVIAANVAHSETTELVQKARPDTIFHLAAEAYVPRSFERPGEVFQVNATGTLHVLEAARRLPGLERIVITSSSEVYGTARDAHPIDESHALRPTSPYAASKAAADRLAYSYGVTYGLPLALIRPFNTFGPRHTYDVIPKFIELALAGKDLTIHGDGSQARDFCYVDDTVRGFLAMGLNPNAVGETVNFGSGKSHTIRATAERIVALAESASRITYDERRTAEVELLLADVSLAERLFGWRPEIEFDDGLLRNIEWTRQRAPARSGM